jgi:hypothetical protein
MDVLEGILDRIDRGTTTMADSVALRLIVEEMQQDIANLSAAVVDALVFDYGVTFPEEEVNGEQ